MDTLDFLAQTSACIKADGKFYSSKDAKAAGRNSTGDDAMFALMDGQSDFTEEDLSLATEALTWIRGYRGDNRFLQKLGKLVALDTMLSANAAMAAFIIPNFQKEVNGEASDNAIDLSAYTDSDYLGEVGQEICGKVRVVSATLIGTRFGKKPIVHFVDGSGNILAYWPAVPRPELMVGSEFRVISTVKAHAIYNGVKQTVIKGKPKLFKA